MTKDEAKKLASKIDGFLADREGETLYELAGNCTGKGVIVEIGSWKGKSTVWLGCGTRENKTPIKIYAVDPHTGSSEHQNALGKVWTFEEFKRNIEKAGIEDIVVPIVKTSEDASRDIREPVQLIFIDGAHEYELAKLDFLLWFPKVMEGGVMAFHDTTNESGPKRVIKEFVYKSRYFKNLRFVNSITIVQKVRCNSSRDRLRNKLYFLLKNIYEFAARLSLPKPVRKMGRKILNFINQS